MEVRNGEQAIEQNAPVVEQTVGQWLKEKLGIGKKGQVVPYTSLKKKGDEVKNAGLQEIVDQAVAARNEAKNVNAVADNELAKRNLEPIPKSE